MIKVSDALCELLRIAGIGRACIVCGGLLFGGGMAHENCANEVEKAWRGEDGPPTETEDGVL